MFKVLEYVAISMHTCNTWGTFDVQVWQCYNSNISSLELFYWYVVLEKWFQAFIYITIKALTCTYVLHVAGLAHFTYSASIVWNRKTQRSLVRGRSTSIYISIRDYIYSVYYQKHCLFFIHSTVFLFVTRDSIYVPPSKCLHHIWIYFVCNDLKEFAFSHDKATSSLNEYFHALEMDKMHMRPVTQKGTSWVDDVISRKYVLKLTSRRAKIAHLSVFQREL